MSKAVFPRLASLAPSLALSLAALVGAIAASPASAQILAPGFGKNPPAQQGVRAPPPPALPGARIDQERVAPAERLPGEMQPTEALFDAINRGDIANARDAISRGADLNGRSVLGMTPLDLSVDLGRNDIAFLLLSLRGSDGVLSTKPRPAAAEQTQTPRPGTQARAQRRGARVAAAPGAAQERGAPATTAPANPRLFAGDGGTPNPQAGFLGFDAGRAPAR